MLSVAIASTASLALIVIFFKSAPETRNETTSLFDQETTVSTLAETPTNFNVNPSVIGNLDQSPQVKQSYCKELQQLRGKNFWFASLSSALTFGLYCTVSTVVGELVEPFG